MIGGWAEIPGGWAQPNLALPWLRHYVLGSKFEAYAHLERILIINSFFIIEKKMYCHSFQ